ncbi:hypothetical protein LCGC14_1330140 [marine sediment metagenome]|uniref:Uncharacterized protein n=1 Tax=marine sediment metagenome TaxID=412755 RepID=A0A0F9MXQ1_9ZZZZ
MFLRALVSRCVATYSVKHVSGVPKILPHTGVGSDKGNRITMPKKPMVMDELVADEVACPQCREQRMDWLVWQGDDGVNIQCATCNHIYQPT